MKWFKMIAGLLVVILCLSGIISCISISVGTWYYQRKADAVIVSVAQTSDEVIGTVEERSTQVKERITEAQNSARELNDRVQQRVATALDVPTEEAPDLDRIERELYARVRIVADWIGLIRGSADLVEQVFGMLESTTSFVQKESHTARDIVGAVVSGKRELTRTVDLIDDIHEGIVAIQENSNVEENAKKVRTISSTVDKSLTTVIGYVTRFEQGVITLRSELKELVDVVRWRLFYAAIAITVLMIWFVIAQVSLAIHAWRFFQAARTAE